MHRDANAFRRFFSASSTSAPDAYHGLSLVRTDALDIVRNDGPTPTPEPALASSPAALFLSAFSPVAAPSKPVATDEAGSLVGGFTLGPIIAHGAFSTIRRATALTTGAVVAVKIVPRAATLAVPARRRLENEESVWSSLSHEHILPLFAAIHTPTHDFFVTQLCPAGSLFDIMRGGIPGRDDAGRMFRQIVRGLRYLHCEKRLVHRDIKLENVLVDEAGVCRIADFGMARSVDGDEDDVNQDDTEALPPIHLGRAASLAGPRGASIRRDRTASVPASAAAPSSTTETEFQPGSLPYAAPELLGPPKSSLTSSLSLSSKGRHSCASATGKSSSAFMSRPSTSTSTPDPIASTSSSSASTASTVADAIPITSPSRPDPAQDIWALGVLLYALLTGNLPFSDAFEPRLVLKILGGTYPAPPPSTPRGTLAVLRGCLAPRVADRWTVEKVDECAWAVGGEDVALSGSGSGSPPVSNMPMPIGESALSLDECDCEEQQQQQPRAVPLSLAPLPLPLEMDENPRPLDRGRPSAAARRASERSERSESRAPYPYSEDHRPSLVQTRSSQSQSHSRSSHSRSLSRTSADAGRGTSSSHSRSMSRNTRWEEERSASLRRRSASRSASATWDGDTGSSVSRTRSSASGSGSGSASGSGSLSRSRTTGADYRSQSRSRSRSPGPRTPVDVLSPLMGLGMGLAMGVGVGVDLGKPHVHVREGRRRGRDPPVSVSVAARMMLEEDEDDHDHDHEEEQEQGGRALGLGLGLGLGLEEMGEDEGGVGL